VWQRFILPDPRGLDPDQYRQCNLSARIIVLLLVTVVLAMAVLPFVTSMDEFGGQHFYPTSAVYLCGLLLSLVFVRRGQVRIACVLVVAAVAGVTVVFTLLIETPNREGLLTFLVVPGMVASIFLSGIRLAVTLASVLLLMVATALLDPTIPVEAVMLGPFLFAVLIFSIFLVIARYRDVMEAARIRERLAIEQRLRHSEKMQAVGTLAGGMAHDFNNILTAIVSYSELIAGEASAERRSRDDAREILKAATRAQDLVRQILAFSELAEVDRAPVEVRKVVDEVLELVRTTTPPAVEFRIDGVLAPGAVLADPGQIRQAITILCANAADATRDEGGVVTIGLSRGPGVEGDADAPDELALTVSDAGEGMAPEVIERIFEPYFTTRAQGRGSGLGLAVAHGIVKGTGGSIEVESEVGVGTVFRVRLPVVEADLAESIVPSRPAEEPHGGLVLLVDDEVQLLRAGTRLLTRLGLDAAAFAEPRKALAEFQRDPGRFALAITDLAMPGMTGVDLAREIRAERPELPVLLWTGFWGDEELEKAEEGLFDEIIHKPFDAATLSSAISAALARGAR